MRRFQSESLAAERWVWDPLVHARYDEHCYYFIIRALDPSPTRTLNSALRELLDREEIRSSSAYVVFGWYDALVRLWATEEVRRRFLRALNESGITVDGISEFRAEEIDYTFREAAEPPADADIGGLRDLIKQVVTADAEDEWTPEADAAFEVLRSARMIHRVPPVHGVKFYLVLKRTDILERDDVGYLVETARAQQIQNISLYTGVGRFADALLKGVFENYDGLYAAINAVHQAARRIAMRPMTLLIANGDFVREVDTIDQARVRTRGDLERLVEELHQLADGVPTRIGQLTSSERAALARLFDEWEPLFTPTFFRPTFLRILAASILGEVDDLRAALVFLTTIEQDLRHLLVSVLSEQLGRNWYHDVSELIGIGPSATAEIDLTSVDDTPTGKGIMGWTLRQLFDAARLCSAQFPVVSTALSAHLFDNWEQDCRSITELRNAFSHGILFETESYSTFDGRWGAELQRLFHAALFHVRLRGARNAIRVQGFE